MIKIQGHDGREHLRHSSEDCNSIGTNTWSMDFSTERLVPNKKLDDPSPLELKRIRETLRIEMTREIERFSKSGLLHGTLQGLIEQEIEIADSAKDWQKFFQDSSKERGEGFQNFLSTRSIFGEESTFHPLELRTEKIVASLTLPVPCRMKFSLRYLPNWTG